MRRRYRYTWEEVSSEAILEETWDEMLERLIEETVTNHTKEYLGLISSKVFHEQFKIKVKLRNKAEQAELI